MAPLRGGLEILHEDEHLLGVVKPAGIPTAHAAAGGDSLYARARAGEIKEFTGISSPYEAPEAPELRIDTGSQSLDDCVAQVLAYLETQGVIPAPADA